MFLECCHWIWKSLCFACLPDLFDSVLEPDEPSIVIAVIPLTAIMEDQVSVMPLFAILMHKSFTEG